MGNIQSKVQVEKDDFFATIRWSKEDIMIKLEDKGFQGTEDNFRLLTENYLKSSIQDQSIAFGWDVIESCIYLNEEDLKRL